MDIGRLQIQDLIQGYERKSFSPTEVCQQLLDRIEQRNPELNAFLEVNRDWVLARAKQVESRASDISKLPLYGVPLAVKDNFLVEGWQASAASKILEGYRSPYTATCVERLEAAGAIVLGKTNLDEFAMGSSNENSAFGPVKNPWDLKRVPGGSSGGSVAAVAAGLSPVSIGTDTGGSIRQPASFCGVVGVKPTYGRVSRYGIIAFASSLDQAGPIARSVWDAARVLEVMAGYGGRDSTVSRSVVPKYTEMLNESTQTTVRNLRVGVPRDWLQMGLSSDVLKQFQVALEKIQGLGVQVTDIELPHARYGLSAYYLIATSEASSNLARYDGVHYGFRAKGVKDLLDLYCRSRGEGFGPEVKRRIMLGTYALSAGYYDAYYLKAAKIRRLIQKDFESAYDNVDVVALPTSPTAAFKLEEKASDPMTMYLSDIFTIPANLAGIPGLSLPMGNGSDGLPLGLQLLGRAFDEQTLFQLAYAYERERGPQNAPPWREN